MHFIIHGYLEVIVFFGVLPCMANEYTSCDQASCDASSKYEDGRKASMLQVQSQRSSLQAPAVHSVDVDPEVQHRDLTCYLKKKLQSIFVEAVTPLWHARPFGGYQKCAVVSSSGAQLKHNYGRLIDEADAVFRFNDAPVAGYFKNVGSRETVRIGNWRVPWHYTNNSDAILPGVSYLLSYEEGTKHVKDWLPQRYPESYFYHYPWTKLGTVAGEAMLGLYGDRWWGKGYKKIATTGFIGMIFAMSFCKSIEAFEMAPSDFAKDAPYKYYSGFGSAEENSWHATFGAEHDLYRRLSLNTSQVIAKTGRAFIPGFEATDCKNAKDDPHISFYSDQVL